MLKVKSVVSVIVLLCLTSAAGHAETVVCPVNADTYMVPGMGGNGYPINTQVKSMADWLTIPALVGFDLENLGAHSGNDVVSAKFKFYRLDSDGTMMSPATAPAGTDFTATIHALDDTVMLTEDLLGGYYGVINFGNRPGVLGTGYSVSNDTGPNSWAEADITQIVIDWLDGNYVNNGIEFQDDPGPSPDNYVWYWSSIQNADNHPYLEVDVVPEPSTVVLLGMAGLLALLATIRRRRKTCALVVLSLSVGLGVADASAHTTWIQSTCYRLQEPGATRVYLNWGHYLPIDDPISHEQIKSIVLYAPGGRHITQTVEPGKSYHPTILELDKPGSYVAGFETKPGYYTMYVGRDKKIHHKLAPMSEVADEADKIIHSVYYSQFGKVLLDVGPGDDTALKPIGHVLEIVPETHPAGLATGDTFRFRVLRDGKLLEGPATLDVSYLGYSTGMDDFFIKGRPVSNGRGSFNVSRAGVWYVRVKTKTPAPAEQKGKYQALTRTATLVFQVDTPKPKEVSPNNKPLAASQQ